jgi:hypothetical protein
VPIQELQLDAAIRIDSGVLVEREAMVRGVRH